MVNIILLGAGGSIGKQTIDVIRRSNDKFRLVGASFGRDLEYARKIIEEFSLEIVCFREKSHLEKFSCLKNAYYGDEGLIKLARYNCDAILVNALVGSVGLKPTIEAIKTKKDIALANKECLVMAGEIINNLVDEYKVKLLPIDSEHSALWQCIKGEEKQHIKKLVITASGGSFRDLTRAELANVTKEAALKHPNWNMGAKITIDSATMMNKGFEIIEAHYLFNIDYKNIVPILHKESIIHSLVIFEDGSIKASLGIKDMRIPIAYALNRGEHFDLGLPDLDLFDLDLSLRELSKERFLMLNYTYQALEKGRFALVALNASNEAAVNLFLNDKIKFLDIEKIVYEYINRDYTDYNYSVDEIIRLDREIQHEILEKYGDEDDFSYE